MWYLYLLPLFFVELVAYENPLDFEHGVCIECHNIDAGSLAQKYSKEQWKSLEKDFRPFVQRHKDVPSAVVYLNSMAFKEAFREFIEYMKDHGNDKQIIRLQENHTLFEFHSADNSYARADYFLKKIQKQLKALAFRKDIKITLVQGASSVSAEDTLFRLFFIITPMRIVTDWEGTLFIGNDIYRYHLCVDSDKNETIEMKFDEILEKLLKSSKILI